MDFRLFFSFIKTNNSHFHEIEKLQKENDINTKFNIFSMISDQYKKENLHSDLLQTILNISAPSCLREKRYLQLFLKTLEIDFFGNIDKIRVKREKGRIDVLLYDNLSAIIIENKINNASDQQNQLARNYELLTANRNEQNEDLALKRKSILGLDNPISNIRIVYLSYLKTKRPNFNEYNTWYRKYIRDIEDRIIFFPVKNDYLNFLSECETIACSLNKCDHIVFFEHYIQLLKSFGDNEMTKKEETEIIKNLYNDKETIKSFIALSNLYNTNRGECLFEIIKEDLCKGRKAKFKQRSIDEFDILSLGDDKKGVYLWGHSIYFQFGFYNMEKFSENNYKEICKMNDNFIIDKNNVWIYYEQEIENDSYQKLKKSVEEELLKLKAILEAMSN